MKFRVKRPNIGSFTQKIKNKLKKGEKLFIVLLNIVNRTIATGYTEMHTCLIKLWYCVVSVASFTRCVVLDIFGG